jgi:acetylornithine deacetylase/succinyl-diaminopimelate desuccinylase-like protein
VADIDAFVQAEADSLVAELSAWCAIPSISTDPEHDADVRRSAEHLAGLMEAAGLDTEVLAVDDGQPAVYAEWLGAGPDAPTVTVYGHHDVQPVDPLDQWTTPPFEPAVRDGCLHARGASDDKGQVHFQVSAVRHLLAADGRLPVNLKFLVEGEEEAGSPNIEAFLGEHAERLACDLILVSDTGMVAEDVPSLVTAMRGLLYYQVDVRTAPADLHSGVFGGTVPNAVAELVALLGRLKDDRGRIAIPGWYDDVRDLEGGSGPERALSDALGADCVYLGVMLPSDRIHAPNERLLLANYYRGVRAAAYTFEELARPEVVAALRAWRG